VAYPELDKQERSLCARLAATSVLAARSVYISRLRRFIGESTVQPTVLLGTSARSAPPISPRAAPKPLSLGDQDVNAPYQDEHSTNADRGLETPPVPDLPDELLSCLSPTTTRFSLLADPFLTSCTGPNISDLSEQGTPPPDPRLTGRTAYGYPTKRRSIPPTTPAELPLPAFRPQQPDSPPHDSTPQVFPTAVPTSESTDQRYVPAVDAATPAHKLVCPVVPYADEPVDLSSTSDVRRPSPSAQPTRFYNAAPPGRSLERSPKPLRSAQESAVE